MLWPRFSVVADFCSSRWTAEVACPVPSQPVWPACWIDTPGRSSSSSTRAVQEAWDLFREELGVVPPDLVLTLGSQYSRSDVDGFWIAWSKGAEEGLFCTVSVKVMWLMPRLRSSSSIPHWLGFSSFVGVINL